MKLIPIHCRSCGATIPQENISLNLEMARCAHCDAVFAIERSSNAADAPKLKLRPEVKKPLAITVRDSRTAFEISRRWFGYSSIPTLLFALLWNGFIVVFFAVAFSIGFGEFAIVGSVFALAGLGLLYYALAKLVNGATIRFTRDKVEIEHGPLPWRSPPPLNTRDVAQLYCTSRLTSTNNQSTFEYDVEALLKDGGRHKLMEGLPNAKQALFIEQAIEKRLRIKDAAVEGELERT